MYVSAAAQDRRQRGEHRQAGGDAEHDHEAVMKRGRDQPREELGAGEDMLVGGGERGQRTGRRQQMCHRVLAEHGGKHRRHRRQGSHVLGDGVRDALLLQPGE